MKGQLWSGLISASLHLGLGGLLLYAVQDAKAPLLPAEQMIELQFEATAEAKPEPPIKPAAKVNREPKPTSRVKPEPKPITQKIKEPAPKTAALLKPAPAPEASPAPVSRQEKPAPTQKALKVASKSAAAETTISRPQPVAYQHNPPPTYPERARRRRQEGTVWLDVLVCEQGTALRVDVARSSGHALLDSEARKAVKHWRFMPARKAGQTVEAHVTLPVEFRIK